MSKRLGTALSLIVLLSAAALAADEKASPFVAHGRVTDDAGKPLEGVEINASCGMGSLFHTGSTKTDKEGKYRLAFGAGAAIGGTKSGVGTQVATITPRLSGWYEIHLGRRGNLLMTERKDKLSAEDLSGYSGVVVADEPYELNFTLAKGAAVQGRLGNEFGAPITGVEIDLTGDILPPSCSILASAKTDDEGRFAFDGVPVWLADPSIKLKWRFTMRPFGVRHELESTSFETSAEAESTQQLLLESTGDQNAVRLTLSRQTVTGKR